MNVYDLKKGQTATITRLNMQEKARARLCALGIIPGAKVTVLGFSLLKSSALLGCGSVRVAVRKEIAADIEVNIG